MKIQSKQYITAMERKHLKAFIQSGLESAKINTKNYFILDSQLNSYKIKIVSPYSNDYGKKSTSWRIVYITAKN